MGVASGPVLPVYHPFSQAFGGGRLFVHAGGDPYSLVSPITRIIRETSADQPVERAAMLADVLTPDRLNALVFGGFAAVALAFSVSSRTREFGNRLALGSQPRHLLTGVIGEGAAMATAGSRRARYAASLLARLAGSYFQGLDAPGALSVIGSTQVLMAAPVVASAIPAMRAGRH